MSAPGKARTPGGLRPAEVYLEGTAGAPPNIPRHKSTGMYFCAKNVRWPPEPKVEGSNPPGHAKSINHKYRKS